MKQVSIDLKNDVINLDDDDFETLVIGSKRTALIDFWADWCQPCHMIAPIIKALAEEYGDRILVGKMDVDTNPFTPHMYGIRSIPALLFFKDGKIVQQITGVRPKEEIARIIENNL